MDYRLPKVRDKVNVIEKRNYESGKLTTGVVQRLLSNPVEVHPRGNKVELEDGTVGRMVSFVDEVGVQTQTDPEQREIKTQEIRQNRPSTPLRTGPSNPIKSASLKQNYPPINNQDRNFNRPFQSPQNPPPPEKISKPSELPGEDDLR